MRAKITSLIVVAAVFAIAISSVTAQPYYQSKEDYLNGQRSVLEESILSNSKVGQIKAASAVPDEPEVDAVWTGATVWMSGINYGLETFGGSIGKGLYFFGSNLADDQYVPVRLILETGAPNQTLCQTFRRDPNPNYASAGVGTFPGSAWDISDPDNPRRLNICFVEDNPSGPANLMWDPNSSSTSKREYLFIMLSTYDGTGTTYAGFDLNDDAFSMDMMYAWWPRVAAGHTFFENEPCTLTIGAHYVRVLGVIIEESNTDKEVNLTWDYAGTAAMDSFNVLGGASSPPSSIIAQLGNSTFAYTDSAIPLGQEYFYRVEAISSARSVVGSSKVIEVPAKVAENIDFVGHWNERSLYGGCWGYTDPSDDKEYALLACRNEGISIIDITVDPPAEVGFMPLVTLGNDSKEVKVYGDYAIVIAEYEPTQIFNISDPTNPIKVSDVMNITGDGTNGAHNCMVDGNYLYVIGNHDIGGLEIWNISNPAAPASVGTFQPFYYHDIDIYNDTLIGFGINGEGIDLVDIGNKAAPALIRRFNYAGSGTHNGEFLQGRQYVAIGDEVGTSGNHIRMFDLRDLDNIDLIYDIIVDSSAVAHNCYARNDTLYIAHYTEGVRMWDVSDPFNPVELGYYDTYLPAQYGYFGVWNVYPFFASGKVIASDMQSGLFVLQPSAPPACCIGNRGDLNGDAVDMNILDLTFCVDRIFRGGPPAACPEEADVNSDNEQLNILDLTFIVDRIFRGGPPPGGC